MELLEIEDFVSIKPGDAIPTDGVVAIGRGSCNESMLTGESRLITKEMGDKLYGGSIMVQGSVIMQVRKTSENATFNQIMALVENA